MTKAVRFFLHLLIWNTNYIEAFVKLSASELVLIKTSLNIHLKL